MYWGVTTYSPEIPGNNHAIYARVHEETNAGQHISIQNRSWPGQKSAFDCRSRAAELNHFNYRFADTELPKLAWQYICMHIQATSYKTQDTPQKWRGVGKFNQYLMHGTVCTGKASKQKCLLVVNFQIQKLEILRWSKLSPPANSPDPSH